MQMACMFENTLWREIDETDRYGFHELGGLPREVGSFSAYLPHV